MSISVAYADLRNAYVGQKIPYYKLLQTNEWKIRRTQVISRQGNACQNCGRLCVDDFVNGIPVIFELFEKEVPFYGPFDRELLGTYPKESMRMVKQKDPVFAQVHHAHYILSRLPWEYPEAELQLLCHKCHTYLHQTQCKIYATEAMSSAMTLTKCERCQGTGYLPQYNYVQDGLCFSCNGFGSTEPV